MQKRIVVTAVAALAVFVASAQNVQKEEPPKPPKPAFRKMKEIPPPPPPPSQPPPPDAPPPPPLPPAVNDLQLPDDFDAFMKRNPEVKNVQWRNENNIIIRLKSGKEERYNLDDEASRKAAEKKYGALPQAPPPPPPPPAPKPPKAPKKHGTLS